MQPSFPGVLQQSPATAPRGRGRKSLKRIGAGLGALALVISATGTVGNAVANGETRTLEVYHTHTKESAAITYKRGGQFDKAGLDADKPDRVAVIVQKRRRGRGRILARAPNSRVS